MESFNNLPKKEPIFSFFTSLPMETQLQIIQESPTFIRLNKNLYNEQATFRDNYCDEVISKQEVLNHIKQYPDSLIIYGLDNDQFYISMYYKKEASNNYDVVKVIYRIATDNIDVGNLTLNNVNITNDINVFYKKHKMIVFDAKTVLDIVRARTNCNINGIPITFTKKYVDDIRDINLNSTTLKTTLFTAAIIDAYMKTTYRTLEGKINEFINTNKIEELLFNGDTPVNQKMYNNLINKLNNDTNNYYNGIMGKLNNQNITS